jgi:hypothetical protein
MKTAMHSNPSSLTTVQEKAYTFLGYWTVTLVSQLRRTVIAVFVSRGRTLAALRVSSRLSRSANGIYTAVLCAVVRLPHLVCAGTKPRHQLLR